MRKIKKHPCDLASHCLSHKFLNIRVDELSDHFLDVRVLRSYGRNQMGPSFVVFINCWVRVRKILWHLCLYWYLYRWWSCYYMILPWLLNLNRINWVSLGGTSTTSHLRFHLILNDKENLLNQLNDVWFLENAQIGWHALCVQPSLIVEISLIFLFIDLPVADFRDLIVSHIEQSPICYLIIVEIGTGSGCLIWLLETDKGSARWSLWVMSGKELDALSLTESLKQLSQIIYGETLWEISNKEIALLLRVLESKLFSLKKSLSFNGRLSRCHV